MYLALAKCHPQSREGVLHCFPEWMLMRACVYVWMLFTPHQTGPAKRCKTGAGSLPNQNNLEECQTLHVLIGHSTCMGYCREKNYEPILTLAPLSLKGGADSWKTVNVYIRKCLALSFWKQNTTRKIINVKSKNVVILLSLGPLIHMTRRIAIYFLLMSKKMWFVFFFLLKVTTFLFT